MVLEAACSFTGHIIIGKHKEAYGLSFKTSSYERAASKIDDDVRQLHESISLYKVTNKG